MSAQAQKISSTDINQSYGEQIGPRSVRLQRLMPASPEKVWAYLTDSQKRSEWLAGGVMEPKIGGKVDLHFDHAKLTPHKEEPPEQYKGCDNVMRGKITRYEPGVALGHTWSMGENGANETEVLFELKPQGSGTLLTLTHSKLPERKTMVGVSGGWHTHIGILLDKLSGVTPPPFWATHAKLHNFYENAIKGE
jgi:uncharacterized protein YndB with AHSA1/START domain